ncbi:MAG: hypothetical protein AAFQ94_06185 [Bacteroidota bacterium]
MPQKVFVLFIILQLSALFAFAQEVKLKFPLKEGENFGINPMDSQFKHAVLPVFSNDERHLLVMASTSGTLKSAYLRKGNLSTVRTVESSIPEVRALNQLIGGFQFDSLKYIAIFNNKKEDSFSAFEIDLTNDTITSTDFSLRLDGERFLHSFATSDKYYIMTVVARSSTIKIYKVFKSQRGTISLSAYAYDFSKSEQDNTLPNLYKELLEFTIRGNQRLIKTPVNTPVSLNAAGSNFKLYTSSEKVILTMDHVHGRTSVYEMFLDSNLKSFQLLYYPQYVTENPYLYTSNSILKGDSLIQMAIGKEEIAIFLQDRTSEEIISEYNFSTASLDSMAFQLIYRDESVVKRKAKTFSGIFKEIYKNQPAVVLNKMDEEEINLTVGTSRPTGKVVNYQTEEFIDFRQSQSNNLSAFSMKIASGESVNEEVSEQHSRYKNLIDYRNKNEIEEPLLESLVATNTFFYYCWYSVYSSELVIRKIPINIERPSYK